VTLEVRVIAAADDAEEKDDGTVGTGSTDLELVTDAPVVQTVGLRFRGITIPAGAAIVNAWIQFETDAVTSVATSLTIQGQNADNPVQFGNTPGNISTRPRTVAAVPWSPAAWTVVGQAGPEQQTPDLAAVIQEIVNRPGWSSGNAMVFVITGSGTRTAESYNGDPVAAPLLHVTHVP
jgi:hypothetical protein